jgi:hypothetical protein
MERRPGADGEEAWPETFRKLLDLDQVHFT